MRATERNSGVDKPSDNPAKPEAPHPPNMTDAALASSEKIRCSSCRTIIEAGDEYCRHCGRRQVRSGAWYYEPGVIAVLALTVLGPFALPLVWKSPRISRNGKWAWTIVLTLLTAVLLWCLWFVSSMFLSRWQELDTMMRELR